MTHKSETIYGVKQCISIRFASYCIYKQVRMWRLTTEDEVPTAIAITKEAISTGTFNELKLKFMALFCGKFYSYHPY